MSQVHDEPIAGAGGLGVVVVAGRRVGFDEFYRAQLPGLVVLARGLCSSAICEDVAQEAMLVAYRRWSEVGAMAHPEAWVRRTCANLAVSQFRRRMIELRAIARLGLRTAAPPELDDSAEEFWALVRRLPHRQAQATALRFALDPEVAEIARTLDLSEGSVKVHLSRAWKRLARELGTTDDGGE